jgi:hypothetical protein
MKNELLLTSIYEAIDKIDFPTKRYYNQARLLTFTIFNQFISDDKINFNTPKDFPYTFFIKIIKRDADLSRVLRELKNAEILITNESYSTGTDNTEAYCKSYIFNPNLIYKNRISFTQFNGINKIGDRIKFKKMKKNLDLLTIANNVTPYIVELVEKQLKKMIIGNNINEDVICIEVNGENLFRSRQYWIEKANRYNVALIKFKKSYYIENVNSFIERKRIELHLSYSYAIDNIKIGNFYANRNKTNNRLDHNLTSLKSELLDYILLSGQNTVEIDIKNAQFAVLANISTFELDDDFKANAINGTLYEYVMAQLCITRQEAKDLMMCALFGEVENHSKKLITLFPSTLESISNYKTEHGYEAFSIFLQKAESNLMIDGIFNLITKHKMPVIPIHDSMRVRVSDQVNALKLMEDFFNEKNFKCKLKNK